MLMGLTLEFSNIIDLCEYLDCNTGLLKIQLFLHNQLFEVCCLAYE